MTQIAPHIAAFLQQRLPVERQASPNTCDSYADAFRLLFAFASAHLKIPPSQLQLEYLDAALITSFLNHLEEARRNGAASRNIRLAAIKSFMRYMEYRVPSALDQIRCILSIPTKKTDTRLVRHLTAKEMQSVLDAPDPAGRVGIRDRAMLHLCFAGGLRGLGHSIPTERIARATMIEIAPDSMNARYGADDRTNTASVSAGGRWSFI
jgi:integrase/recombinase XerD